MVCTATHPELAHEDSLTVINVYVQPKAGRTEFGGLYGDAIKIRVKAPPVDGAGNRELTKYLAAQLGVPKSAVAIVSGHTSRRKRVSIEGVDQRELIEKLGGLS